MSGLVRGGKLSFKGGSSSGGKKKRRREKQEKQHSDEEDDSPAWTRLPHVSAITGPVYLEHGRDATRYSLKLPSGHDEPTHQHHQDAKVQCSRIPQGLPLEPANVLQVLVAHRLVNRAREGGDVIVTLKSSFGAYLGSNRLGEVIVDTAVAEQNEWIVKKVLVDVVDSSDERRKDDDDRDDDERRRVDKNSPDDQNEDDWNSRHKSRNNSQQLYTLCNCMTKKFLSIDRGGNLRCDLEQSDGDDPSAWFSILVQKRILRAELQRERDEDRAIQNMAEIMGGTRDLASVRRIMIKRGLLNSATTTASSSSMSHNNAVLDDDDDLDEEALERLDRLYTEKYHSHSLGRKVYSSEGVGSLKRAKQEGRLREEMLDRREKMKSDKFCK